MKASVHFTIALPGAILVEAHPVDDWYSMDFGELVGDGYPAKDIVDELDKRTVIVRQIRGCPSDAREAPPTSMYFQGSKCDRTLGNMQDYYIYCSEPGNPPPPASQSPRYPLPGVPRWRYPDRTR